MLDSFHFIRPSWLLALIPLLLLAWRLYRPGGGDNPWSRIVDARLLPLLMVGRAQRASHVTLWLVAVGWTVAALALADPTWERKPQPVYQTTSARVIVLDLARSMDATDLKPSRLARARYKVEDVLALSKEGQTGLVAYAGDAFTVSPLTRDVNTIRALLKVLDPGIMPSPGSRADLGLLKAGELLRQAGTSTGQVLLIADGIDADNAAASERAATRLRSEGYRVSVLGIDAEVEALLPHAQGEPARDAADRIVNPQWDPAALRSVARAGGGEYRSITDNGDALNALLSDRQLLHAEATVRTDATTQGWKQQGPLLAVLLIPLAALAFRRNWLLGVVLLAGIASPPQPAMASTWDDLWRRPDQQAANALGAGDYAAAAKLATDVDRRGSAEYKRGNYQLALDNFAHASGGDADYNRGNALAKLGQYRDAITAYDKSLNENASNEDARVNKAAVEALLKQQQQEKPQNANSKSDTAQKDQSQGNGGGQKPPQPQSNSASAKDGKSGQPGTSSGQEPQPSNAQNPGAGSQNNGSSGEPDANASHDATGGKSGDQARQANGSQSNGSQSNASQSKESPAGKEGEQQGSTTSGAAQQTKAANQFAEAASKLAAQRAGAKADDSPTANTDSSGSVADQAATKANAKQHPQAGSSDSSQPLDSEERMAAEQWLRRIPDDPGGLLRRKFLYQYRQRVQQTDADAE